MLKPVDANNPQLSPVGVTTSQKSAQGQHEEVDKEPEVFTKPDLNQIKLNGTCLKHDI